MQSQTLSIDTDTTYFSEAEIISVPSSTTTSTNVGSVVEGLLYTREDEILEA